MQDESTVVPIHTAALACCAAIACATTASAISCAPGEPPRSFVRLLDRSGSWSAGKVVGLDATHWIIESRADPSRPDSATILRIDRGGIVAGVVQRWAIEPYPSSHFDPWGSIPPYAEPLSNAMLEMVDGQRLPGTYQATASGASWDHRWIGAFPLMTDRLAAIRFIPSTAVVRPTDSDVVILSNGDRISGFVESLGTDILLDVTESGATVEADSPETEPPNKPDSTQEDASGAKGLRKIPVDRVAAIAFAAIGSAEQPKLLVWTMDGSVVGARELAFDDTAGWSFSLTDPTLAGVRPRSTADNMAADPVGFVADTRSFIPLATLGKPKLSQPEGAIHYRLNDACRIAPADQVSLGLATVELTGPVVAEFRREIPDAGAARAETRAIVFSAIVRLAEPAPLDAAVDVIIELGGDATRRFRLDATHPVERLTLEGVSSGAPRLSITLDEAGNGPIGDRVLLERAVFVQRASD